MHDFENCLKEATSRICATYFQLPVVGLESPIYRERVYCYELYYQLRINWTEPDYFLSGEVDKSGHPMIRGNHLDRTKPDFLVHVPGGMNNFAVVEVKPITGSVKGIKKDIQTLGAYLDYANYQRAFYLIYGCSDDGNALTRARAKIIEVNEEHRIELWHHAAPMTPASRVPLEQSGA
ncbi:MAG: methionyl-tRNA formyltransferase-like protein [Gammaproteobacteria bacterium]